MADRVPSDHETIDSHRVALESVGRTSGIKVSLPDDLDLADGDVVRLTFDGAEYHARVQTGLDGTLELRGAFDNPRLAKTDEGSDRLAEWIADSDVEAGRSVLLDVLTDGYHFGLREPGQRVVYTVRDPPSDSLSSIADSLGE